MTKTANKPTGRIQARARQLLDFARERAKSAADWVELHNAVFGIAGKATELFPTEAERTAFTKTDECKQIYETFNQLPHPPAKRYDELLGTANGAISVRLPRSVHAALLAEAEAEGVSLNQLCLSKLLVQLRCLVR
jgi:predicted HicB family RNase H-like nuclease